ncbi:MAG: lipid-binding SYLF domain-containing protein [Alphaproteobacteria bacterium]
MRFYILKIIILLVIYSTNLNIAKADNDKKVTAMQLIHSSEQSLKKLLKNTELKKLGDYLNNSRAILIFPEVYEGGLIFGAKGGNGLLLIRRPDESFSGPFFYSIGGLSFGLQIGIKSAQVAMTIMTNRGLNSIVKERIKLGVDLDTALINTGVGFSAESTLRLADVYTFSDNSGLFVGGSFEGSYLQPRNDLNRIIHGMEFTPDNVLDKKDISKGINGLIRILNEIESYKK